MNDPRHDVYGADQPRMKRYADHGTRAIETHPDVTDDGNGLDYVSAAKDTIASILHATNHGTEGDWGGYDGPQGFAEAAVLGFLGDFEDVEPTGTLATLFREGALVRDLDDDDLGELVEIVEEIATERGWRQAARWQRP